MKSRINAPVNSRLNAQASSRTSSRTNTRTSTRSAKLALTFALTFALAIGALGFTAPVEAATMSCSGDYMSYHFMATGKTMRSRVANKVNVVITEGGRRANVGTLRLIKSSFAARRYLKFSGRSTDGKGDAMVNTVFDAATGKYVGTLAGRYEQTSIEIPVICSVRGALALEDGSQNGNATVDGDGGDDGNDGGAGNDGNASVELF